MKDNIDIDQMMAERDYNGMLSVILDDEPEKRLEAFVALWKLADIGAIKTLTKILKTEDESIQYYGIFILSRIGGRQALEPIRSMVNHSNDFVASTAIKALRDLKDPLATRPIVHRLTSLDGPSTILALEVLGDLGDPRAIEHLYGYISDPRYGVAETAKETLQRLGASNVFNEHHYVLSNGSTMHEKIDSMRALGQWGDPRAINTLLAYLNEPHPIEMYKEAAQAVMRIKDPRGIQLLKHIYEKSDRQNVKSSIKDAIAREAILDEARQRIASTHRDDQRL